MKFWAAPVAALLAVACSSWHAEGQQSDASPTENRQEPLPETTNDPGVARMKERVARHGAQNVVRHVSDSDADWRDFLDRLSKGDPDALALAATLRPKADAGTAESLDMAIAQALPYAPLAVLKFPDNGATVESLCTSPFIEPEPGVERRYNRAALNALDTIPPARRPEPTFDRCHAALERIGAGL